MAKQKKKAQPAGKKPSPGKGRHSLKRWIIFPILAVLLAGIGITFIPDDKIPNAIVPLYDQCLTFRNTLIVRSGLPVSRFEDKVTVRINGTPDLTLYFAPSPVIDKGLCAFIDSAQTTLDVCAYDLKLENAASAIVRAKERGVQVRVVTDSDNYKLPTIRKIEKAGIKVQPDRRPTLMHNKFVIVDMQKIWTGSYNFTNNGTNRNDNNAVILESPGIAACYRDKFEELFSGKFGINAKKQTKEGRLIVGELPVIVAFSPSDKVTDLILSKLATARKSVCMMAFSFTSQPIAKELTHLAEKGVRIRCLFDYGQSKNRFSKDEYLASSGIKVRLSPNRRGKMHHKVIIIDEETVITGSFNFSSNAERSNDENILILRNSELARQYLREFNRCWKGTKGY